MATHRLPKLSPMLASVGTEVPTGPGWTFEPKFDGVRVLAVADPSSVALLSRNGRDKREQFPEIAAAVRALATRAKRAIALDGEIVARVGRGVGRFQNLQGRINLQDPTASAREATDAPAALAVFDLLVDGKDTLVKEPWTVRRQHLEALFTKYKGTGDPALILTRTVPNARPLLTEARRKGWEGIMAKRTDAPYSMGQRSAAWLKLKLQHEQEFVVGGFTEPQRSRPKLGALHVGYYDRSGRTLHYAGLVGGGFTHDALRDMRQRLAPLERTTSPFSDRIARTPTPTHWVEPRVVVEVKFNEWTADGRLRQPVFLGIRDDKKPRDVVREASSIEEKS